MNKKIISVIAIIVLFVLAFLFKDYIPKPPEPIEPVCGDGILEAGEECEGEGWISCGRNGLKYCWNCSWGECIELEPPVEPESPIEPVVDPEEPTPPIIPEPPVEPELTEEELAILKFEEGIKRGELFMSPFVIDRYEALKENLILQFDLYLAGEHLMTAQAVQLYFQVASMEAGKDSFIVIDPKTGEEIVVPGWTFDDHTTEDFFDSLNKRLKTKI